MSETLRFSNLDLIGLKRLAERCAAHLPHRCLIRLSGTLGAGKTAFAQAFSAACGIDATEVTSPTFTLVQQYSGDRSIYHIDAYRIADEDEFVQLGGEELLEQEATVLIEWPERIAGCLPSESLNVAIEIEPLQHQLRTVQLSTGSVRLMSVLAEIAKAQ